MEYKLRIGYKPMIIIFQYCLDILCRSHRELSGIIKLFLSVTYSIWKTKASQFGFKLKETGIFRSPYVILIIWCCDLSIHLGSSISCKGLSGKELMTYLLSYVALLLESTSSSLPFTSTVLDLAMAFSSGRSSDNSGSYSLLISSSQELARRTSLKNGLISTNFSNFLSLKMVLYFTY